jgi:SAM-dependent methyltransferase
MNQNNFEWTPDFWQGWRESDNPYRQHKSRRDRLVVLKALELHDGERVLEVGFGYGWISQSVWGAAKIDWYGVDRSAAMAYHLRQLDVDKDRRVALADGVSLPFQEAEFDKVLCTGVLMHIAETDMAVRELVRVLRNGGRIVCSINNSLSPYSLPVRFWNRRKKGFVQKFRNPTAFRKFLHETGVAVDGLQGDGIVATVPVRIGNYRFPPIRGYSFIQRVDEWVADRLPWLAYEIWFSGVKRTCP